MRALFVSVALVASAVAVAPPAAAEPCEVPGCQIGPAVVCIASNAMQIVGEIKSGSSTLRDCLTAPA